jgi:hypothetical protein
MLEEGSEDTPFKNLRSPSPTPTPLPTGLEDIPSNPPTCTCVTCMNKSNRKVNKKLQRTKTINYNYVKQNEKELNFQKKSYAKIETHVRNPNCPCTTCNKIKKRFKTVSFNNQFRKYEGGINQEKLNSKLNIKIYMLNYKREFKSNLKFEKLPSIQSKKIKSKKTKYELNDFINKICLQVYLAGSWNIPISLERKDSTEDISASLASASLSKFFVK